MSSFFVIGEWRNMIRHLCLEVGHLNGFSDAPAFRRFSANPRRAVFYNRDLEYVVEPGDFRIGIGGSLETLKFCDYAVK